MGMIFFPSWRPNFFGLGLPSPLVKYTSKTEQFSILYPNSWKLFETPQGDHGDMEAFVLINNPTPLSFARVLLARKPFPEASLEEVSNWGAERAQNPYWTQFTVISEEEYKSIHYSGLLRTYSYHEKNLFSYESITKCEDYLIINNSIGYDIDACADQGNWNKLQEIFLQMIDSFVVN
jgi:hypothetical protein